MAILQFERVFKNPAQKTCCHLSSLPRPVHLFLLVFRMQDLLRTVLTSDQWLGLPTSLLWSYFHPLSELYPCKAFEDLTLPSMWFHWLESKRKGEKEENQETSQVTFRLVPKFLTFWVEIFQLLLKGE